MVRVQALECASRSKVYSVLLECVGTYTCLLTAVRRDLEGRAVMKVS